MSIKNSQHAREVAAGQRFEFGKNWYKFLRVLDEECIAEAQKSLSENLGISSLEGKTFLDIGSGSGLFSLAARRLGASVYSFDYDSHSVNCTRELKRRYFPNDSQWSIGEGSALDMDYLHSLGQFDVVYSWGVLHHTGDMWKALDNIIQTVAGGGSLFISIYNDQGLQSRLWRFLKHTYNRLPGPTKMLILGPTLIGAWLLLAISDLMRMRPFETFRNYGKINRGMSFWRNVVDWAGGYPFEVARPEEIIHFYHSRGFTLERLIPCSGSGCSEFVFSRAEVTPEHNYNARQERDAD